MHQSNQNVLSLANNYKQSDSPMCEVSSSSEYCDTHTLLPEIEESANTFQVIKSFTADILQNHFKIFIFVCDVFCIFTFTLFLLALNAIKCNNSVKEDILEWCKPFEPVDNVIVDLNFDLLVHCDMPKSCVAYAEILMEKQGFNYNFIIGDEDLVYVGKGYQCQSDALRLQMLITRYTWDPKQPVYRIPEEVVVRYSEIIQEGLQCGKISPNFTVTAKCSLYGDWCGAPNIRDHIPWTHPAPLAHAYDNSNPWYEQQQADMHPFFAFDIDRVYGRQFKLKACNITL